MIGETGERKSAVATPDGKSRKKKKKIVVLAKCSEIVNGSSGHSNILKFPRQSRPPKG